MSHRLFYQVGLSMRMRRSTRVTLLTSSLMTLLIVAGMALAAAAARGAQRWNLDVERAMDAIGLVAGMVVGEAGAGEGYFTFPMARRVGPGGFIVANDISRRALQALERQRDRLGVKNVQTVVGETDDPLFARRDLQMVVIVHAFHEFSRPVAWLVNVKRYLRAGATVAIIDRDPGQKGDGHFWSRERVVGYATEAGYDLVPIEEEFSGYLVLVFQPLPEGQIDHVPAAWPGGDTSPGSVDPLAANQRP